MPEVGLVAVPPTEGQPAAGVGGEGRISGDGSVGIGSDGRIGGDGLVGRDGPLSGDGRTRTDGQTRSDGRASGDGRASSVDRNSSDDPARHDERLSSDGRVRDGGRAGKVQPSPLWGEGRERGSAAPEAELAPTPARRLAAVARRQLPAGALTLLSIGLLVGFWYLATEYRWQFYVRFTNIPSPVDVFRDAGRLIGEDKFLTNIVLSLQRIMLGFAAATVLGVGMGLVVGRYALARRLLFPALEVLRPIPAIAWVPISIMLWPTTETSIVFITFIGAFFPILLNTIDGVAALDDVLLRAARCLGASELALMTQVVLRGAMPQIFTGLAVGMGVAWVSLIAAEMISGQFGIGYFTWEAYSLIEYSHIVIGMIIIGVLGLACSGAIRLLARVAMPWHAAGGKGGAL